MNCSVSPPHAGLALRLALVLAGLMLALPFLVPWHRLPVASFESEALAFLLGTLACLCSLCCRRGAGGALTRAQPVALPRIASAALALLAIVLWQLASGQFTYPANGVMLLLYLLWALGLLLLGQALLQRFGAPVLYRHLAGFLLAGGVVNAVFGLLQYFSIWSWLPGLIAEPMPVAEFGVYGNLAQQNHFASHMALSLSAACYLRQIRTLSRWQATLLMALLGVALFLSGSRSSVLYLAWIGLLYWHGCRQMVAVDSLAASQSLAATEPPRRARGKWWWMGLGVGLVVVLGLGLAIGAGQSLPQLQRLTQFAGAIGSRGFLWQHAWQMFLAHPLTGVGFDGFAFNLIEQLTAPNRWGVDQYAHNLLLQLLANAGLPGLLALLLPAIGFVRRNLHQPNSGEQMLVRAVLGLLVIHSMLEQPLYFSYFLGPTALLLGASDRLPWHIPVGHLGRGVGIGILGCGLLLLLQTCSDYEKIEGTFYSQRYFVGPEQAQARTNWVRQRTTDAAIGSLYTPLLQLVAPQEFVSNHAPVADKLALNWRVLRYAPIAETEFRHAALLAEAGQMAAAQQQFRRAALAYPAEAASYAARFAELAKNEPARYGQVADYAQRLLPELATAAR